MKISILDKFAPDAINAPETVTGGGKGKSGSCKTKKTKKTKKSCKSKGTKG